jgi:hypothetical protein
MKLVSATTDSAGFLIACGSIVQTAILGTTTVVSNGQEVGIVFRMNAQGRIKWASAFGTTGAGSSRINGESFVEVIFGDVVSSPTFTFPQLWTLACVVAPNGDIVVAGESSEPSITFGSLTFARTGTQDSVIISLHNSTGLTTGGFSYGVSGKASFASVLTVGRGPTLVINDTFVSFPVAVYFYGQIDGSITFPNLAVSCPEAAPCCFAAMVAPETAGFQWATTRAISGPGSACPRVAGHGTSRFNLLAVLGTTMQSIRTTGTIGTDAPSISTFTASDPSEFEVGRRRRSPVCSFRF